MVEQHLIKQAAQVIAESKQIAILTGAGVSKESGVPTFRDAHEGLWSKYDPQQLATPMAFRENPQLVWDWYQYRRELCAQSEPNPGHLALAYLEKRSPSTVVITQNVDDLHEQAGSTNVIHLHGNIAQDKCFADCQGKPTLIDISSIAYNHADRPPKCPHCGNMLRPNVVWFHEILPENELAQATKISHECDVMIVVGTSGLVTPAATLPSYAKSNGATIIEVNPDYSMITRITDIKLEAPSGEVLPKVIEILATL